jgi:hypothetical protein
MPQSAAAGLDTMRRTTDDVPNLRLQSVTPGNAHWRSGGSWSTCCKICSPPMTGGDAQPRALRCAWRAGDQPDVLAGRRQDRVAGGDDRRRCATATGSPSSRAIWRPTTTRRASAPTACRRYRSRREPPAISMRSSCIGRCTSCRSRDSTCCSSKTSAIWSARRASISGSTERHLAQRHRGRRQAGEIPGDFPRQRSRGVEQGGPARRAG